MNDKISEKTFYTLVAIFSVILWLVADALIGKEFARLFSDASDGGYSAPSGETADFHTRRRT